MNVPAPTERLHSQISWHWLAAGAVVLSACLFAVLILPDNVRFARPHWLLHPDETGYLITAKHLAESGSPVIEDDWYKQRPSHVPPGAFESNGKLYPLKAIGGYLVFAVPFLISDDAWLYVTPLFGLLASLAVGALIQQRTNDWRFSAAGALVIATSSPFIGYASGLAFADIIAVTAMLWACFFLLRHLKQPSTSSGLATALCIGYAVLTRPDFVIAAMLMAVATAVFFHRTGQLRRGLIVSLPGIIAFGSIVVAILLLNDSFYGSPFKTGYVGGWQESPGGVASSFGNISIRGLLDLSKSYLLQIGLPATLLLIFGLGAKGIFAQRGFDHFLAVDIVLIGTVLFTIAYFLGRPGAYGTEGSWLVSSYPRYILAVYAIGVVLGFEGLWLALRSINASALITLTVALSITVLAMSVSVREAFTSERGILYIEHLSEKHLAISDVIDGLPESVIVVSDLNSKAILNRRTITPSSEGPTSKEAAVDVTRLLQSGERVVAIGDSRTHPLYTNYLEEFSAAGLTLQRFNCRVELYEVLLPSVSPPPAAVTESCP
jgi:hypothetical protein